MSKTVLITGTSSGIGRALALHLDEQGWRVFAGVRRPADAASLRREASRWLVPLLLDVTVPAQIATAVQTIDAAVGAHGLDALVNNAGISLDGPLEFFPLDDLRTILEVNTIGPLAVAQVCLPLLRRAHGRIINVSSMAGKFAGPFYGPYHTSKFALEGLSDALRLELAPHGVAVVVVEPGSIASEIWGKAEEARRVRWATYPIEAEQLYGPAARATHQFVERMTPSPTHTAVLVLHRALHDTPPRTRYLVGLDARGGLLLSKLPDKWRDWLIQQAYRLFR